MTREMISPLLFSFNIKQVVETILGYNVGCRLEGMSFNIFFCFADEIAVLAPSKIGLPILHDSHVG